jgi:hypothetical protein
MRKSIIAGLAIAGVAVVGGSAFTAGGLTSTAPTNQFIGGQVGQHVTGAAVSSIVYNRAALDENQLHGVTVTFSTATVNTITPTVTATTTGTPVTFTCEPIGATTTMVSACVTGPDATTDFVSTTLTDLTIDVPDH